jgi:nickel transport protein
MPGRITYLSPLALSTALLALVLTADNAYAHRLDAQAFVLPNHHIQIESWFSTGEAAKDARVQVFGAQGQLLAEGQMNQQGIFVFPYGDAQQLKVVVSAGAGHRKELTLSLDALTPAASASEKATHASVPENAVLPAPVPLAERDSGLPIKDVLVGVGFLLALAAFVLSLRNARKLRTLEQVNGAASATEDDKMTR